VRRGVIQTRCAVCPGLSARGAAIDGGSVRRGNVGLSSSGPGSFALKYAPDVSWTVVAGYRAGSVMPAAKLRVAWLLATEWRRVDQLLLLDADPEAAQVSDLMMAEQQSAPFVRELGRV
jgi:hypothetical protein